MTPETWLRVQDILAAHAHTGEKDRVHTHYLRSTIFCGGCGRRLIFSRNVGNGGSYDYFVCPKRHGERRRCTRRAVRVERVEDGVTELYRLMELSPEDAHDLREVARTELAGHLDEARRQADRATSHLTKLHEERAKLLRAHYADAVPADLLRSEMARLTAAMREAEQAAEAGKQQLADVDAELERVLVVASNCHRQYEQAPAFVKRQINQGFFAKLYIDQDGSVEHAEMNAPFAQLLPRAFA